LVSCQLAVSTASPAFGAPVQEQAHTNIDERASALPSGVGQDVGSLLKTIGTSFAFGALSVALEHFLGGNSTRRALPSDADIASPAENDKRDPAGVGSLFGDLLDNSDSIGKVIGNGLLGGVASGAGALGLSELLNHTRREPEPLSAGEFSGIATILAGALASLGSADGVKELFGRDDVSPQDLIDALQLLGAQADELD